MALTLRGTATSNAINGGNVTVTHPGGTAANDVMFLIYAFASSDNVDDNIAASTSGSTELADLFQNDNRECQLAAYRKVMPSTPDSSFVVTGGGSASDAAGAVEHMWTGVDTTTPEDATTTTAGNINSSIPDPPSITTVTDNAIVIAGGAGTFSATRDTAVTQPAGYSNQLNDGANDTNAITVVMASKLVASHGAENPGAWSSWTDAVTESWNAVTIAVRPAAGADTLFAQAVM